MYTQDDHTYMQRALTLATLAQEASPNPRVGCVLVKDGRVLAEGYTQRAGGMHAEIHALEQARLAGESAQGATAYVTLEPCAHFGRTPPCARSLIHARLGRVVVAVEDPNPLVAGKGLQMLRDAGIDVRCGLLAQEARATNIGFFSRMLRGRPWVRLKLAASLDGRIALPNGVSQWITGAAARQDAHQWRAHACAVLTGIGTVLADNPQLTARGVPAKRQPLKIILDSQLRLPPQAHVLDGQPPLLVHAQSGGAPSWLTARGVQVLALPGAGGQVDLPGLLVALAQQGINELHVEAGGRLSGAFMQAGLVDELLVYQAGVLLGPGQPMVQLPEQQSLDAAPRWRLHGFVRLDPDWRFILRRAAGGFEGLTG